ncbi:hypothetical protein CFHF_05315 [Caulobacter flavus]|uniref:Uncharacterized protein n=1 Tax=Caulobacter flavus TaxID=1679497 RepID=A0A2N5CWK0_9CAUL|nr:hypothetical protein CFHF_05315 [Caulobacter flavus]
MGPGGGGGGPFWRAVRTKKRGPFSVRIEMRSTGTFSSRPMAALNSARRWESSPSGLMLARWRTISGRPSRGCTVWPVFSARLISLSL